MDTLKTGDRVTYKDVNLWSYKGVIINTEKGPRGGDCHVKWQRCTSVSEECTFNLKKLEV